MSPHSASTTVNELVNEYADIIKGKVILTTGVTLNSLGGLFIQETASKSPELLILAGRNASKLQELAEAIAKGYPSVKTRNLVVDLSSLASVRKAAEGVNSWEDVPVIDVLVNNAGIMAVPYAKSVDGFESQFAICHLSRGLQSYSVHPGLILTTGLGTHLDFASMEGDLGAIIKAHRERGNTEGWKFLDPVPVEVGAATHAFAAFDPNLRANNGAYLLETRVSDPFVDTYKSWARDPVDAEKLWRLSEELVGQKFGY
ncbi:unnamed protein product [Fusarium graminearum]|nr:unnamed protein product [Fusarium graminearum]